MKRVLTKIFRTREPFSIPDRTEADLKRLTSILFIDDHEFRVVDILRKNGWQNTYRTGDVSNLDNKQLRDSHIIFVDIHGVGRELGFSNEGLGLITALKERYPEKRLVVYSAETEGDRFDEGLYKADFQLKKNADPYNFLSLVDDYSREMFELTNCVYRLQEILKNEFNIQMSGPEIEAAIRKIARKGDVSEVRVAKAFNINNAGSIASLLGLFFQTI